jgi:unsaturated chondroitin disaccharide hydrolase
MSVSTAALSAALDVLCQKLLQDEPTLGTRFPYVTHEDGSWDLMAVSNSAGYRDNRNWDHGNWFCGFWVGLLAAAKVHSGDEKFLELARERMVLVAERADDPNTHDIGFIFLSSALPLYHLTGETRWRDLGISAANRLRSRLVVTPKGGYISSWGPMTDARGRSSSAIDTMANIPLLYWAARETGDASYALVARAHALHTLGAFVRDDLTMYHAVEYDTATGERLRGYTFQGMADESSWSRGTGWAVYGLAATAAATSERFFLNEAERLAEKWLAQLNGRIVPPWDFDDKGDGPEDSSASAIMAAALLDVASLQSDPARAAYWRDHAIRLLTGLCESYLATEPGHRGLLKHACYSQPHRIGVDSAVMFGDYFFIEALMRVCNEGAFIPAKAALPAGETA